MERLRVIVGNIVSDEILKGHDLIVNPTNPYMLSGGGVCGAIFEKAGKDELEEYTQQEYDTNMKIGEVRITPGFNLGMDIMFVQGPKEWEVSNPIEVLIDTYEKMLENIYVHDYKNVLIPSLGTGIYGFKHEDVGHKVYNTLKDFLDNHNINIDLVIFDLDSSKYYK